MKGGGKDIDAQRSVRSRALDLLRFPLAVVVVTIHAVAVHRYMVGTRTFSVDRIAGADWFFRVIEVLLKDQSVPIYFFIAGYVFFLGLDFNLETYSRKLRNRVHSLLVPYLLWNTLGILAAGLYVSHCMDIGVFPSLHLRINPTVTGVLQCFWDAGHGLFSQNPPYPWNSPVMPQDYPLWFVRDLMLIVLCAPVIYLMLKRTRWFFVAIMGFVWAVLRPFEMGHLSQLLTGFFFFSWGAYLSYHGKDMITLMRRRFRPAMCVYLLLCACMLVFGHSLGDAFGWMKGVCIIAGMVIAYGVASKLVEKGMRVSRFLASASFFVYAGHGLLISYAVRYALRFVRPTHVWSLVASYVLAIAATVGVLLLLFYLLGKFLPSVQKLLNGRTWRPSPRRSE